MHEHKININLLCALRFRFSLPSSLIEHDQVGVQFDNHPIGFVENFENVLKIIQI